VVQAINKNPLYPRFDKEDETLLRTFSAQAALAVRNSQLFQRTSNALKQSDALLEVTQALSSELKIEALISIICSKVQSLLGSERCTVFIVEKERMELYTTESMSYGMGPSLPIDHDKATLISFPMDRGIAGAVATTGQRVNIPDAYRDSRFNQMMDKETGFRTRSILCMAIKNHRGEIAGVLQVMNKKQGTFSEEDEKMLGAFCAQAAVAIENSRLFQQTERALNHALADQRNLKFMLSVTKNLFSDLHLTSMIDQMTMQVHHLLKADDCALYLVDEEKREFWLAKEEEEGTVKKYPFMTGIVGVVAQSADTIRISSHAHADVRFNPLVDQRRGKVTHSILCCPIKAELPDDVTKIVGVISVRDEKDRGGFEQEEEKLLKVFCAQAAVAIMNSKRFSSIMEQSEVKESDHSAADYLKVTRGMNLASDDINSFQYRMDEIVMKGAIGTGSYGEVYKALVRGKIVAVKKLHVRNLRAEQIDSFCSEASLMCQLNHPNIVGFIGAVTEPSNLCILTQFCNRGSLADLLLELTVVMNFAMKVQCALDAAQGMLYLHNSNPVILHRDLKSDNLLVTSDWTVKVADFGLTRFISEKKQMTQVGTPMWMAPEIIMGKKYTEKADVYAFGIILWEILTRDEPYEEKEPMQIVVEVVNEGLRPTIAAEMMDSPLVPLMTDCWHTEPQMRPTFEKIVERLKVIKEQIPLNDNSEHGIPGTSRIVERRRGDDEGDDGE
jgi:GAF domain-containing protein